jgi:hypothetical protein
MLLHAMETEPGSQRYSAVSRESMDVDLHNAPTSAALLQEEYLIPVPEVYDTQRNSSATDVAFGDLRTRLPSHQKAVQPPPRDWPTSPKRIKTSLAITIWNAFIDIIFFACSVTYLTFGLIVNSYDQAPTAENPHATGALTSATKWVSKRSRSTLSYWS